jgi:hypothetical protein
MKRIVLAHPDGKMITTRVAHKHSKDVIVPMGSIGWITEKVEGGYKVFFRGFGYVVMKAGEFNEEVE